MDEIKAMLQDLAGTQQIEYSNLHSIVSFNDAIGKEWMFFCAGVTDANKRNSDQTIAKKKYFYVDIDIRSVIRKQTQKVIDDTQMEEEIIKILDCLESWWLWSYKYCVITGNWIHLYYVWTERAIDHKTYSDWVDYFYWVINDAFLVNGLPYTCDSACKNIARISRLPWSINRRLKTYKKDGLDAVARDLTPYTCIILYTKWDDPSIYDSLEEYAEHKAKETKEIKQVIEDCKSYNIASDWLRSEINQIDITPIVCDYLWVRAKQRWDDILTLYDGKRAIWAYIYRPYNILKTTWTTRINSSRDSYTTYEFVLFEICWWDKKKAKEYFEAKHGIKFDKYEKKYLEKNIQLPQQKMFKDKIYRYPSPVFDDDFEVLRSWELCLIASPTNSWKSTFVQGIILRNKDKHKCLYINLEFDLERGWEDARKRSKWFKVKIKWSEEDPYTQLEKAELDNYIQSCKNKMEIVNLPQKTALQNLIDLISDKIQQWYSLFVIDTFSSIGENNSIEEQNTIIRALHDITKFTGCCIIAVHHFNKWAKDISWSQKLSDLSNVVITLYPEACWSKTAIKYKLIKDKAWFGVKELILIMENGKYYNVSEANLTSI